MKERRKRMNHDRLDLFRYGIISPLIRKEGVNITQSIKELSEKEYWYQGKTKKYSESTIRRWYYQYKKEGFESLERKQRKDKEKSRKLEEESKEYIIYLREKYPKMTTKKIYEKCIEDKYIDTKISIDTVYDYCKTNDMKRRKALTEDRRRFEKRYPNELWQGDTTPGPYIKINGVKYRTYLIHFIDDYSRLIVGHGFYMHDNGINVQNTLKEAIKKYGLPKKIYLDNGKSYRNEQLDLICARLGIKIKHTHPYDPESKGKVERSFRTVQDGFIHTFNWNELKSLEELNQKYDEYLYREYTNKEHSEKKDTPNNVFHKGIEEIKIEYLEEEKIEEAFMHEITRKVGKDRTIQIQKELYEVPNEYKLQTICLRYYVSKPEEIWIYEGKERKEKIKKLEKQENGEIKRKQIKYRGIINDESDVKEYEEECK